jgi:ribosome-associated translation inhibitor RaiA
MRIQIDAHQCELAEAMRQRMHGDLDALARQVADFPVHDVHVLVEFNRRSNDYSVKTTLVLPGTTLVGSDHDPALHAAYERCLNGLRENVRAYKERLDRLPERHRQGKGTDLDVQPDHQPQFAVMDEAVRAGDYERFRSATAPYDEPLRKRIGRWVERLPEIQADVGNGVDLDDMVEAVFLQSFDTYLSRPAAVPFGDWLEGQIDPALRALHAREEVRENVRMARSARGVAAEE